MDLPGRQNGMRVSRVPEDEPEEDRREDWAAQWQGGLGRDDLFRKIFDRHFRQVYAFFIQRGFSEDEAYDLGQETFVRAYKNLDTYRGESHFGTWLFQITTNVYRNEVRSRLTHKRGAAEVSLDAETDSRHPSSQIQADPLDEVLSAERQRVLNAAIRELPPQMRRCVELRILQDLKYREIAELMRVSIDTVKAHLFQARQLLKSKLGDYFNDQDL